MPLSLSDPSLLQPNAFIGGKFSPALSGETFPVTNPATQELVSDVANCGADETKAAIKAAHEALGQWRRKPAKDRSALLLAWRDIIVENIDDLALLLCTEQGKSLAEAKGEILYGASYIQWFAEEAKRVYGEVLPSLGDDARLFTIKQPVGVVGCITPWNFPNAMLARKIAPALAAGCTVVCKPANETPLSALAIAELARRVGIPAGVINVLCGKTAEIGHEITSSEIVRKLTFTGSTAVGKLLTQQCVPTLKRTSMELGGNAPFIVFESADLDAAVKGLIANKFRNAGQTCVCTNRVIVQRSVADAFASKLSDATKALKVGDGTHPDTVIGPLINKRAVEDIQGLIEDARAKGARIIESGDDHSFGENFMTPKVICDATRDMRVFSEEIFGPIAPIFSFDTEEEAIELANDTPFGLAAYFFSQDMSQIWRVGEALEAGMVGVNDAILSSETIPFGGVKESGQGREGSRYGLDEYLEIKHLKMGGLSL